MRRRILVGTDLGPGSNEAIVQGERRATRDRAALTFAHVVPTSFDGRRGGAPSWQTRARAYARVLEQRVWELTGRMPGSFDVVVEAGSPHVVLARLAAFQHALLVLGASSSVELRTPRLPGVVESIAAFGTVPVFVARRESRGECVLAVVAHSLDDVLATAIQESELSGKRLAVLRCVDTTLLSAERSLGWQNAGNQPLTAGLLALRARELLNAELQRRQVRVDLRVAAGSPEVLVPDYAKSMSASLLVLACPEPNLPAAQTVNRLLRDAPCPVLIARRVAPVAHGVQWVLN